MASEIESLLDYALNVGASDLIVTEGAPSAIRFAGRVCAIPNAPVLPFGSLLEFLGSLEGESGTFIGGPWLNTKWRVKYFRGQNGFGDVLRFGDVFFEHFAFLQSGCRARIACEDGR